MAALNLSPSFDEQSWIIKISRTMEELDEDGNPVCIFNVPKTLLSSKPDSYIPQQVALGPYHFWREELYEMQRYKLAAAKRFGKQLQSISFQELVENVAKLVPRIRACYHKYLDLNGQTLAWMMAVDACFLLEFLHIYSIKDVKILRKIASSMSHLVDYAGMKSAHNAVLRDVMMLENQIPLFLLRNIMEFQSSSVETADDVLNCMLIDFCREVSPLKMKELPRIELSDFSHLLEFLYNMIVPRLEKPYEIHEGDGENEIDKEGLSAKSNRAKQFISSAIRKLLSKLSQGPVGYLKDFISEAIKSVGTLLWRIITRLPGFAIIKKPLEIIFHPGDENDTKPKDDTDSNSNNNIEKPPLIEEIMIPSVTQLYELGVRFSSTKGDIKTVSFDIKTATFYLPTVSLDVNTEVILRNLVAYEASTASGPLVLTRYTELMNGIIDTEEDVRILRENGIILNRLKSDQEVANMWNGMSQSVKLTKVPFLDKAIENVNKFYHSRWKVKAGKFMKTYVFGSWKCLTFLATIMLLLFTILQGFCSVYECHRIFHIDSSYFPDKKN